MDIHKYLQGHGKKFYYMKPDLEKFILCNFHFSSLGSWPHKIILSQLSVSEVASQGAFSLNSSFTAADINSVFI